MGGFMIRIDRLMKEDLREYGLLLEELSEKPMDFAAMERVYGRLQADLNYNILTARCSGILAGSVMAVACYDMVASCRPFMVLENLVVREDMRGRGIGTSLLAEAENLARSLDCFYIIGISGMNRTRAHLLYEKTGFAVDPVRGFRKYL